MVIMVEGMPTGDDMDEHIGVPIKRAAEIIGVSRTRLISWGRAGILRPRMDVRLGVQVRWLYSIDELAAGRIIRCIEEAGVDIRHLTWLVRAYESTEHPQPLLSYLWAVDRAAHRVYLSADAGASWMDGEATYQYVLVKVLNLEEIRAAVRDAASKRPGRAGRTRVAGGRQVFEGTRVPVDGVRAWIEDGASDERILEAYPAIERADIVAVRREMQATG